MNALTIANANDPALLQELKGLFEGFEADDLSSGVQQSYPIMSFKGKAWRVKFRGEDQVVLDPNTGDPVQSILAVIVKASPFVSKLFYERNYTEGDDSKPTCFSLDGIRPDASVTTPQSQTCATCPKGMWGSKVSDNGQKLKACSDHKRIAVVPFPDLSNQGNGPILMRIPPSSLQNLAALATPLKKLGVPYQAVVVKIGFDHNVAFPKLIFTPVRALNREQAAMIKEYLDGDAVERMLSVPSEVERADLAPQPQPEPQQSKLATAAQAALAMAGGAVAATVATKVAETVTSQAAEEAPKPTPKQAAMDEGETISPEESSALDDMLAGIFTG